MGEYILALDQGTTSSRAILFDGAGQVRAAAAREFKQYYPKPGWVEHDPEEIWESQRSVAQQALARANAQASDVAALGITNQRETEMLRYFHIPNSLLPEVTSSSGLLAETNEFGGPISIAGAAGDQQASLFGHQCFELGSVKNTYGTGCFLLMNTGAEVPRSRSGLL